VEDYLAVESVHYEERLRVHRDIAGDALDAQLPPMLLQLLVENAIKHGIARTPGGGELGVSVWRHGSALAIEVSNPGRIDASAGGHGVGPGVPADPPGARAWQPLRPATERPARARAAGDRAMNAQLAAPPLRVLIVDDTRLARQELRTLLGDLAQVECVGEADDVPTAQAAIERLQPDLVLLDIQMPSGTGFDVLAGLDSAPMVVFTTAYDHYAVRAFEANALDYLVKPVVPERLAAAIDRARSRQPVLDAAAPASRGMLGLDDQVFLHDGERCWFVALGDSPAHRGRWQLRPGVVPRPVRAARAQPECAGVAAGPGVFFRANRNTLVNLRAVRGVELSVADGYVLKLKDGSEVEVSRRQARELRERLAL
jgi:two-component system LytT family response regulator